MRSSGFEGLCAALLLCIAARASAQSCPAGVARPDFGYGWVSCPDCLAARMERGVAKPVFTGPPQLHAIRADGPAAGKLREGDRLLAIDGLAIQTAAASDLFHEWRAGATRRFTIDRDGERFDVDITPAAHCGAAPPPRTVASPARPSRPPSVNSLAWLGMGLSCPRCAARRVNDSIATWSFPESPVVAVIDDAGPAARAGLDVGDTLIAVDGMALTTAGGERRMRELKQGELVRFTFRRGGTTRTAVIQPAAWRTDAWRPVGSVGTATVEIRGNAASVRRDSVAGALIIEAGGTTIRVRDPRPRIPPTH
jgi:regulator of sigma E protease